MKKFRKRVVRYGLLAANVAILLAVVTFMMHNSTYGESLQHSSDSTANGNNNIAAHPLDQVSSADIAVNLAYMAGMPERVAVTNEADSFNTQTTLADDSNKVVAKPQVLTASAKSRKDIKAYTTQATDTTVSGLASKFGVTSDSIKNTNSLTTDTLAANQKLTIPPDNGIVITVQAKDTIKSIAEKYSVSEDVITSFNDAEVAGIKEGEQIFVPGAIMPVIRQAVATVNYAATDFPFGGSAPLYAGANGYAYGWCTYGAAVRRAELGRPIPSNLGNASTWYILAMRAGLPTGSEPQNGAVVVNQAGNHVMVVEQVNDDGTFWVWEMNGYGQRSIDDPTPAGGWSHVDYHLIKSVGNLKFIY